MAEKRLKSRIILKHDTAENWSKAANFIPEKGEIIIYDIDSTHSYERVKVGDGETLVSSLPFIDANKVDKVAGKGLSTNDYTTAEKNKLSGIAEGANKTVVDSELSSTSTNPVQNKAIYAKLDTLIGGTPVSEQITTAIANKVDKVSGKGLSTNDYTTNEKNKLSGIASGAEVNQNAFSNISVGSTTISADTKTDTLTLVAGSNVTITPDATNDKITIAATNTVYTHPTYTAKNSGLYKITVDDTGHVSGATAVVKSDITGLGIPAQDTTYSAATTTTAGLMSATDKATLEALDSYVGDKKVSDAVDEAFDNAITGLSVSGKVITYTKGDGSTGTITTQDTDTKYTHPTTSGNKHIPSGGSSGQILRWSSDGTAVWGADNNTTYSAGTGISLSGTTFSNSGVRGVTTGSANGTISVNTNGTSADVAVKGLGSAAYTASTAYDAAGAANTALISANSYTDAEITEWVGDKTVAEQVGAGVTQAKNYTDSKIDALVGEGASTTLDTIGEISAAIEENQDMIGTLNSAIGDKASKSDLTSHTTNKSNPHGVTKTQVGLGNVPNVATNDQTPTFIAASTLATLTSGEKLSVAFGKISKAITDLISHIGNKSNPHGVTAAQVGADASGAANDALISANAYTDAEITEWVGDTKVSEQITTAIANKSDTGHTHNYAGSSSAGGAANSVKANLTVKLNSGSTEGTNLFTYNGSTAKTVNITPSAIGAAASSHGNHVPATETANNAKFLRNDNTWQTVTPANIGAAATSHGTHVSYSTTAPVMDGTASVGSAATVARSDHKHPTDTSRAAASDLNALKGLVGDTPVSEQINNVIEAVLRNQNLLDNWYFADPVNSQGLTSYLSGTYAIDRWFMRTAKGNIVNGGFQVYNADGISFYGITQALNNPTQYCGKTLTFSAKITAINANKAIEIKIASGSSVSGVGTVIGDLNNITTPGTYSVTATIPNTLPNNTLAVWVVCRDATVGASYTIESVKLEFGSISTLASDPVPNKADQVARCSNYDASGAFLDTLFATQAFVLKYVPKIASITLSADDWIFSANAYYQDVVLGCVTTTSKVDLQPTYYQLAEWQTDGLAFSTESKKGIVRVWVTDVTPREDITVQVSVQEVLEV